MTSDSREGHPNEANREDTNRLAAGASVATLGTLGGSGLYILGQVLLARVLGPQAFGLYALGWTILRMVGVAGSLGLDKGIVRYATRYASNDLPRQKGVIAQSLGLALTSGLAAATLLYFSAPWLAVEVFDKRGLVSVIRWLSLAFVLAPVLQVAVRATTVSQKAIYAVYAERLTLPAASLALFVVFYAAGWRLSGALAAVVGSFVLCTLLALYFVWRLFPVALSRQVKGVSVSWEYLTFSVMASFATVFSQFNNWVDRLFVGYFRPSDEVGIYQAMSQASVLFSIILAGYVTIFGAMIADLHHRGETQRLNELYKVSTKWVFYLSLPPFLVMFSMPDYFVLATFGPEYVSGALPLVILIMGQLVNAGSGAVHILLVLTGYQRRWVAVTGGALLLTVALNLVLIPVLGLTGAAVATTTSVAGLNLVGLYMARRYLGLWPYDLRYMKGLLAAALALASLLGLREVASSLPPLSTLAVGVVVCIAVFSCALALFGLDTEDREYIRLIRGRLRGRKELDEG